LIEKHTKPEIEITLNDGKKIKGNAYVTTPEIIAKGISKNLFENSCVAKVIILNLNKLRCDIQKDTNLYKDSR